MSDKINNLDCDNCMYGNSRYCITKNPCTAHNRFRPLIGTNDRPGIVNKVHCIIPTLPSLQTVLNNKIDLLEKKNSDYGNSFEKILDKFTALGIDPYLSLYTRIHDKFSRFEGLAIAKHGQQVKDESILDTLQDLSNYIDLFLAWKLKQPK